MGVAEGRKLFSTVCEGMESKENILHSVWPETERIQTERCDVSMQHWFLGSKVVYWINGPSLSNYRIIPSLGKKKSISNCWLMETPKPWDELPA